MSIVLTAALLQRLCRQNSFDVPQEIVLFPLRGCVPVAGNSTPWGKSQTVELANVDHVHMRCTMVMWHVPSGDIRVFLASTVPHRKHIFAAKARLGMGANLLLTGRFTLQKGPHPWTGRTSHPALRQIGSRPHSRTQDDLDFDGRDRVEFGNPNDNCHAGYCQGPDDPNFESAGCTVIQGYPKTASLGNRPATGAWAQFSDEIYNGRGKSQKDYVMILLSGYDAARAEAAGIKPLSARIRFGSIGALADRVRGRLVTMGYLKAPKPGRFGQEDSKALHAAQEALFGPDEDDGICGDGTAARLQVGDWPNV